MSAIEPTEANVETLRQAIRNVPDFPKEGIIFKDITPILADPSLFQIAVGMFIHECQKLGAEKIVGIDARGFIFGAPVAHALGIGFVPLRKKGKLPYKTRSRTYSLEYGEAELQVHTDAVHKGEKVVIIDDLLATGGTAGAGAALARDLGAELLQVQFLVELSFLNGREQLGDAPLRAFIVE
jgi:adenine phosphoribosyltransferase